MGLAFVPTGPAAVTGLRLLSNSTGELMFGWNVSEGWVDHYDLYLYNQDNLLQDHSKVGAGEQTYSFSHLLPGTSYKLVIFSKSRGSKSSDSTLWSHTGIIRISKYYCYKAKWSFLLQVPLVAFVRR